MPKRDAVGWQRDSAGGLDENGDDQRPRAIEVFALGGTVVLFLSWWSLGVVAWGEMMGDGKDEVRIREVYGRSPGRGAKMVYIRIPHR